MKNIINCKLNYQVQNGFSLFFTLIFLLITAYGKMYSQVNIINTVEARRIKNLNGNSQYIIDLYNIYKSYKLVWSDEFNESGNIDQSVWNYENGFARNHEDQWYQPQNTKCRDGMLIIEARKQKRNNPMYEKNSKEWRKNREFIEYTSSSINTSLSKNWLYGIFEIKAKYVLLMEFGQLSGHLALKKNGLITVSVTSWNITKETSLQILQLELIKNM